MSNFLDINKCNYLYLTHYSEPDENSLILVLEEASASGSNRDVVITPNYTIKAKAITSNSSHRRFVLYFDVYVVFHILNESYGKESPKTDQWEGNRARKYSKSSLLDYIEHTSIVSAVWDESLFHHGIYCLNHLIEIVSLQAPEVREFSVDMPVKECISSVCAEFLDELPHKKNYLVDHR